VLAWPIQRVSTKKLSRPAFAIMQSNTEALIEKIQALSPDRLAEVEDFVDFIRLRDEERALLRHAASASAPAFAAIWSNPEDDCYDAL
jgi:hypothetical protein